jgi:hypothetical protein
LQTERASVQRHVPHHQVTGTSWSAQPEIVHLRSGIKQAGSVPSRAMAQPLSDAKACREQLAVRCSNLSLPQHLRTSSDNIFEDAIRCLICANRIDRPLGGPVDVPSCVAGGARMDVWFAQHSVVCTSIRHTVYHPCTCAIDYASELIL